MAVATSREESRRGTGQKQFHPLGVQQPAREGFPAGHDLDFVQQEHRAALVPPFRVEAVVFLHDEVQVGGRHAGQALVFEAEVQQTFPIDALRQSIRQDLPQQRGLAGATHPDDRHRLA